jgi:2-oxo-4-hydroxy-4-carboxy-5-ureidoimidazoline decarboxylase
VDVTASSFLAALDRAGQQDARAELLTCCASRRWADELTARRPYPDLATLTAVSDAVIAELAWADLREAVDAHPRIGERATGEGREARWSRAEQAAAAAGRSVADELVDGNLAYERRFGHVFLICATGRSAEEILAALRERLDNDEAAERAVVREELRRIVGLRLAKLAEGDR